MKRVKKTQMHSFDGATLEDFTARFNRDMDSLARKAEKVGEPVIDLATLQGYVLYESLECIPEGIRDVLELQHLRVECSQCREYHPEGSWGTCTNCRGNLRPHDEACEKLFRRWEAGDCWLKAEEEDIYIEAIDKYKRSSLGGSE